MTGNPVPQIGFGSKGNDGLSFRKTKPVIGDLGFDAYTSVNKDNLLICFL